MLCVWLLCTLMVTVYGGTDVDSDWSPYSSAALNGPLRGVTDVFDALFSLTKYLKRKTDNYHRWTKDLAAMKADLNEAKKAFKSRGSTFVRWGRTNCTGNSQLVYSGMAGGAWYNHEGAAATTLCLTNAPQFDGVTKPRAYSLVYGTEYQDIPGHHDQDVPCAVCGTPLSSTLLVPGTHTCPVGWTSQYTGHLVAGHHSFKGGSDFLCLDGKKENLPGGTGNKDGHLFYYTLAQCGSLRCPPYINDRVVTCVVCSK